MPLNLHLMAAMPPQFRLALAVLLLPLMTGMADPEAAEQQPEALVDAAPERSAGSAGGDADKSEAADPIDSEANIGSASVGEAVSESDLWPAQDRDDAEALYRRLSTMTSLVAEFSQLVYDETGEVLQESYGDIAMTRPNKLRWIAHTPFRYELLTDGETLWRYDPDLDQLDTEPFQGDMAATPALILNAEADTLRENFRVERLVPSSAADISVEEYFLGPRNESIFTAIKLRFVDGFIDALEMQDNLQQRSVLNLAKPKFNDDLPESLFVFRRAEASASSDAQ